MEAILVEYPKEDLYEDGELNQSEVDYKLLVLWKRGDIVLARYAVQGEANNPKEYYTNKVKAIRHLFQTMPKENQEIVTEWILNQQPGEQSGAYK